ncbi:hypothetical protein [Microbulbifer sp. THAF38]|uniref:hypothetical protein n=1 Tax=Microbulbifer sp. THAF38 TaxID=2587856 RepID=UPI001268C445|nr:hypothetical protein [Microbulbifer sp. THAF38]QFT55379.1 hypothetical protein FIU95_12515 [Microbulbifer sp. THAF38]
MIKNTLLLFSAVLLTACVSNPPVLVPDSLNNDSISAVGMTCSSPHQLSQDCSGLSGPTKKISISGMKMKVAGSSDGTVIVMFGSSSMSPNMQEINTSYELIKRELVASKIGIIKVTPVISSNILFGYAIETDKPAYELISKKNS